MIDEGHNSALPNTNLTDFSKILSVERRWIVTGTPTTNLLGLSFGSSSHDVYLEDPLVDTSTSLADPGGISSTSLSDAEQDAKRIARIWTHSDREDLRKLANMMTHFLGVPQFVADMKTFSRLVMTPLLDSSGPRPGAIQVLTQVMSTVMIRHRLVAVIMEIKS